MNTYVNSKELLKKIFESLGFASFEVDTYYQAGPKEELIIHLSKTLNYTEVHLLNKNPTDFMDKVIKPIYESVLASAIVQEEIKNKNIEIAQLKITNEKSLQKINKLMKYKHYYEGKYKLMHGKKITNV